MRRLASLTLYGGTFVVVLGASKLHASVVAADPYDLTSSSRFAWAFGWSVLLCLAAYGVGLPDLVGRSGAAAGAAAAAAGGAAVVVSLLQLVVGDALLPRFVVLGSAVAFVPLAVVASAMATGGRSRAAERDRVMLVAEPEPAAEVGADLEQDPERPARVVGVLCAADAGRPDRPLVDQVRQLGATVVVLDRTAQTDPAVVEQVASLHEDGIRVRTLSLFYEEWLGKLPLSELERVSLMFDIGEVHRERYARLKRLLDVAIGLLSLVPLVLLVPVVLVGNVVANRGPLFYRQHRVGKGGHVFDILKFRTMTAGDAPTVWTADADPRITPFGRLLRTTHLDEVPQALNILRGDLSVVGPRPEQPHYVEELAEKLPYYELRHLVRPGLTGWAQVKYHYGASEADAQEKLQYEFFYLRHQGLALDLRILVRTVRSVLRGQGR